jgi:hypothetical protein
MRRRCPQCGGRVTREQGTVVYPGRSRVAVPRSFTYPHGMKWIGGEETPCVFLACATCEWCQELNVNRKERQS